MLIVMEQPAFVTTLWSKSLAGGRPARRQTVDIG